jgi:hypothetical protein
MYISRKNCLDLRRKNNRKLKKTVQLVALRFVDNYIMVHSKKMEWAGHTENMGEEKICTYRILD